MADQHHLVLLDEGIEALNRFASDHPDTTVDLSGADLAGRSLAGVRISGANLAGANLERCDLARALLNSADLRGANLRGANLSGASLHRADISGADMREVTFEAAFAPRLCVNVASFAGVRWSREQIEDVLAMVNQNADWEITYTIAPRQTSAR